MIENLEYNSSREKLIIPEYGRHVQKMVDDAISIKDREERNKVAHAIIGIIGNLSPHLRDVPDFQHKLWDQLFIISDFKLDVDSPYPKPSKEVLEAHPGKLEYPQNYPRYRFYGNNIKRMIDICNSWEEGDLKQALKYTIANHMKKCYLNWNRDTVTDKVIFGHLYELSEGKINLEAQEENLINSDSLMRSNARNRNGSGSGSRKKQQHHHHRNNRNHKKRY